MRYYVSVLLIGALLLSAAFRPLLNVPTPPAGRNRINWISFKQAYELQQQAPRKVIVDVYTSWCGWCRVMDQRTFSQPAIINYVNEHYYAVKLDAEMKEDVTIGQQTFRSQGNVHELAVSLLQGKMGYPTTVFMNEKMEVIQPVSGYLEPRMFHQIITYFGADYHQKEPFDAYKTGTYVQTYQSAMPTPGK